MICCIVLHLSSSLFVLKTSVLDNGQSSFFISSELKAQLPSPFLGLALRTAIVILYLSCHIMEEKAAYHIHYNHSRPHHRSQHYWRCQGSFEHQRRQRHIQRPGSRFWEVCQYTVSTKFSSVLTIQATMAWNRKWLLSSRRHRGRWWFHSPWQEFLTFLPVNTFRVGTGRR